MSAQNLKALTQKNTNYRKVIFTNKLQLVLMCLKPGEEIGLESHTGHDQFFRIEAGTGLAIVNNKKYKLKDDSMIIVPSGTQHNIINTSKTLSLKLYTIYAPPTHKPNEIQRTKI